MFDLTDYASYKAYFLKLATENKLLGATQFLFGDVEVGQSEASEWKNKKLWAWPAESGRMEGEISDNFHLNREGSLWLGGPAPDKFADRDTYYNECEVIMKQLITRIIDDRQNDLLATEFINSQLKRQDMMLSATPYIGCEFTFTFRDFSGFIYDEDEWNLTP